VIWVLQLYPGGVRIGRGTDKPHGLQARSGARSARSEGEVMENCFSESGKGLIYQFIQSDENRQESHERSERVEHTAMPKELAKPKQTRKRIPRTCAQVSHRSLLC
jgi:hypothetical protein